MDEQHKHTKDKAFVYEKQMNMKKDSNNVIEVKNHAKTQHNKL